MATGSKSGTAAGTARDDSERQFLIALGQRVRSLRNRNGTTRKALAAASRISERHLANLEYGEGNVSILVLLQVSRALNTSLAELIGDFTTRSTEWLMIRSLLEACDEPGLRQARLAIARLFSGDSNAPTVGANIALIGLRGAGKSTLGKRLAQDLGRPFVELSRAIETQAGCRMAEIQDLYGIEAYRRHERRALEQTIGSYPDAIIATPGGLVADASNYEFLLATCTSIWLQASPQDHMQRVIAQGDFRPMAESAEAMSDLKSILAARADAYARAELRLNTSLQPLEQTYRALRGLVDRRQAQALKNAV